MKQIILFLSLFLILSCSEPMPPEPQIIYLPADEPAPIPPLSPPESPPVIGEDPEEPPEILSMIIAYLNYDGKLFSYSNKAALVEIQDGSNLSKAGDLFIESKKAGVYDGVVMYQGLDGNIYRLDNQDKQVLLFLNTRNEKSIFPAGGDGVVLNYRFIKNNGIVDSQSYVGVDNGIVFRIIAVGSIWDKYIRKDGAWLKAGSSIFSEWIKHGQVNAAGKIIISGGTTLENDILIEPTYNVLNHRYSGGNAFIQFIQPGADRHIFTGIGYRDGIAYFLSGRDGKIYKYDVGSNLINPWVQIATGTGNYEIVDSYNLFEATAATLVGDYIIYWQDGDIKKMSVVDGTTEVIAQATGLRCWPK